MRDFFFKFNFRTLGSCKINNSLFKPVKMKVFVFFVCLIGSSYQWSYNTEYRWPGECTSGTQQSPINIVTREAILDTHHAHIRGPVVFRGYHDVALTAFNDGHTLKWTRVEDAPAPLLSGGPLRGNYSFLQFHLHWLSEHAIDNYKYPLEIHMVHIKTGLTLEEALVRPDGLAVVGFLYVLKSGAESEHTLAQLMPTLPEIMKRGENQTMPEVVDITRLFSPEPQSFFTYHGSLTTPDCQEVVTWIVMDKPLEISDNQYKYFSKVDIGETAYNFRSLHPANRVVYRSIASCASIASPAFLGFLLTLLSCTTSSLASAMSKGVCLLVNIKRKIFGSTVTECSKLLN